MSDPIGYDGRGIPEDAADKLGTQKAVAAPPAEKAVADVTVTKADQAEAVLRAREQTMENLAVQLTQELNGADSKIRATIRALLSSKDKPSKKTVGLALSRMLELLECMNKSDTVIRNFLYNNVLGTQLQLRALRRVLDKRLGVPISDEELKAARESILSEDQKAVSAKNREKDAATFEDSVKSAQTGAAVSSRHSR